MVPNYPRIEMEVIDNMSISFKKGVAKVSFEVPRPGPEILRLIYLQATAQPLKAVIESPQAELDLKITPVNLKTGEIEE